MKANRGVMEDQLEKYEAQLVGLKSFLKELNDKTAEHGTDREMFEEDLMEAEHNIKFYEAETARIRKELGGQDSAPRPRSGADDPAPGAGGAAPSPALKIGIGSLILSSLSFVAGALVALGLKSRQGSKDAPEDKSGS